MTTNNKDRGYIVDVISENEKKKFECLLCLAIIKEATHGCKKHVFCKDCIHDYIKSIERKEDSEAIQIKCPAGCGHTFNKKELISSDIVDQFVNQIACRCKDCDWNGELLDFLQVHDGKCLAKEIPCHLCSTALKRKDMDHHSKDVCIRRPMVCRGCQKNFPFVDHLKHEESCDDIKVECSFKNFGCNVQETRRNMIAHENNSYQQHLSFMAKYFSNKNNQLKEETKQLKEENKQSKEENKQVKEENKQLKEESKQSKEENKQVKEKAQLLETNIKVLSLKVNIQQILLKESVNNFFHFPAVDEMHIQNIGLLPEDKLFDCFSKNNFTWIIDFWAMDCDVLNNYKEELNELFSTIKTIMIIYCGVECYFFQIDDFKFYKSEKFSIKKDGNILYIENHGNRSMLFYISKWEIEINMGMMEIDITKHDERFQVFNPPHLSSKYFCVCY